MSFPCYNVVYVVNDDVLSADALLTAEAIEQKIKQKQERYIHLEKMRLITKRLIGNRRTARLCSIRSRSLLHELIFQVHG